MSKDELCVSMSIANPTQEDLAFSQDVKNILREINETPWSEKKSISQKTLDRWQDEAQGTVIHGSIEGKEIIQGVGEVLFSNE